MVKYKILMLNTLPIRNFDVGKIEQRTAGNQTLYNTLKGYSDNDVKVIMITFCDVDVTSKPFPNVVVRRSVFFPFINKLMDLKKKIIRRFKKRHQISGVTSKDISRTGRSFISILWGYLGVIEGLTIAIKFKPDIIYGYEIFSTRAAQRLSRVLSKPFVTRFQGTELGFFINNEDKFWAARDFVVGTGVMSDLTIMANDGTDGDIVADKLGLDSKKVCFWVNGLHDKNQFLNYQKDDTYRLKHNIKKDAIIITTANRFVDWKRIDRLLLMMSELEIIMPNALLIVIGDGPEKSNLLKMADDLKINNVRFLGMKEHHETIYHIANSDLYMTLNHSGNLGNSILEALALGVPVITISNRSVRKVLQDGFNSILIEEEDLEKISKIVFDKISNFEKIMMLRKNSKEYARVHLQDWSQRMVMEVEKVGKLVIKN